jgi:hypothetical protein
MQANYENMDYDIGFSGRGKIFIIDGDGTQLSIEHDTKIQFKIEGIEKK